MVGVTETFLGILNNYRGTIRGSWNGALGRVVQVEQMSSYLMSTNNKLVASVTLKMELVR